MNVLKNSPLVDKNKIIITDRYATYNYFPPTHRQLCWALYAISKGESFSGWIPMRQKQKRFEANKKLDHLIEPGKQFYQVIKGQWHHLYFQNKHPIVLELGCGHGAYTIELGKRFPESNFIGIDIKGDRLWKGAQTAQEHRLQNVAFLRIPLIHLLDFFVQNEVTEIWITFPDPRPKNKDIKRRLTHPWFLQLYHSILVSGGKIHLKTDSFLLFQYTWGVVQTYDIIPLAYTMDLYNSPLLQDHFDIQTTYEKRFLAQGRPIYYSCFIPSFEAGSMRQVSP